MKYMESLFNSCTRIMLQLNQHPKTKHSPTFCDVLFNFFNKLFLNMQIVISIDTVSFILSLILPASNKETMRLASLVLNFVPTSRLHLINQLPAYLIHSRMSLKNLSKLTVLSSVLYPKDDNICQLPVPRLIKNILLSTWSTWLTWLMQTNHKSCLTPGNTPDPEQTFTANTITLEQSKNG